MIESTTEKLLVRKIENGTVIDHIPVKKGLKVMEILNLGANDQTAVVLLNVESRKLEIKDMVKVEGREITEEEASRIALVAPDAVINIIRNWEVVGKKSVTLPNLLGGIVKCPNSNCISNSEPVKSKLIVEKRGPIKLRCYYCERIFDLSEIKI